MSEGLEEFQTFARATSPRLFRTALLMCGDWHLAEDLTQTALGKVFASWQRVRRADSPEAYARTVLLRTYFSHRRLRRSAEQPVGALPDSAGPETDAALRVTLLAALARLKPKDRAVLVLRYWEDRSVRETATALSMSEGSVRVRCARALDRLRALVGDAADGHGGNTGVAGEAGDTGNTADTGDTGDAGDTGKDGAPHGLARR